MMNWIIGGSLHMRVVVVAAACALIFFGVQSIRDTRLDVFPEFAPPYVEIQTEAPGLSTEEVESLISVPLENALNSTPFVSTIRSKSVLGLSSVKLLFEEGTDLNIARQHVQERVSQVAPQLPTTSNAPIILPPLSSTSRVLKIGVTSDSLTQMEMSELAKWTIRPRLMSVPGVANVAIWGQRDRQLQVLVNPRQLAANGVSIDEVAAATTNAITLSSGGYIDSPNQRIAIRHKAGIEDAGDLSQARLTLKSGLSMPLGEVANIQIGHPLPIGDAIINGKPGLLLIVEMYPWGNTLNVTRGVESALDELAPGLTGLEIDSTIFRPATFIERSIDNLSHALLVGCVLVVVILFLFLMNWRAAAISAVAIPFSLLSALLIIDALGQTINTMVIAGLAIALGSVVDDAIIDVENIARRLRLNQAAEKKRPLFDVVLDASMEIRSAIVYATLIVVLVFTPVFFLDGLSGSFFRPLALAYVLAMGASLVVALTLTPALSYLLLPHKLERQSESMLARFLTNNYEKALAIFVRRPSIVFAIFIAAIGLAGLIVPTLGQGFLPKFKETDFLMHWVEKPGTSIDAMNRITIRASDELLSIPGVRNFGSHIGRAEVADEVVGPNFTELWISIDPDVDYDTTIAKVQNVVDGYPGLHRDLLTYLSERIKEVISGSGASIVIRIFGPELDGLRDVAHHVADAIHEVDGVTDLKVESQVLVPQILVSLRPDAAAIYGVSEADVRKAETTFISGRKLGELYEGHRITDVVLWSEESVRADLAALRELLVETSTGVRVPLQEVATIEVVPTPNVIQREAASRKIDVTCNVAGRDLGSVANDIENIVRELSFPTGYHPEFKGEFAERQASRNRLIVMTLLAAVGVLVLLQSDFQSPRLVFIVFLSLPFALLGGLVGAILAGGVLSLGSMVGLVGVLGIAARNGIMLVSHYRHLREDENLPFDEALIFRGAKERLLPILMTALTTGLALLPIVWAGVQPGYEIENPMAWVILGGLITSTLLNLFMIPSLYYRFAPTQI